VLKNCAEGRDPALCGFCKCSHIFEYAALSKTPHALADGLMLVLQHPVKGFSEASQTFSGMAHDFKKTIFQILHRGVPGGKVRGALCSGGGHGADLRHGVEGRKNRQICLGRAQGGQGRILT
jgi:hypothetical protein